MMPKEVATTHLYPVAQRGLDKMQFYFAAGFTQRRLHASDAAE
jgi:hypothetical protein